MANRYRVVKTRNVSPIQLDSHKTSLETTVSVVNRGVREIGFAVDFFPLVKDNVSLAKFIQEKMERAYKEGFNAGVDY